MVQVGNSCSWSLPVRKALVTASNSRALMCLSDSSGFHRPDMMHASQCASHPRREASVRWTVGSGCTVGEPWNTLYSRNHLRDRCVSMETEGRSGWTSVGRIPNTLGVISEFKKRRPREIVVSDDARACSTSQRCASGDSSNQIPLRKVLSSFEAENRETS